jgi:hypothetical protein
MAFWNTQILPPFIYCALRPDNILTAGEEFLVKSAHKDFVKIVAGTFQQNNLPKLHKILP